MRRLHLVDGTYELFRAHYSKRPEHLSPEGKPLKATVGVVHSLLFLLQESAEPVTHVAVAFDNPIVSFRNELFAGYKTDEGIDPDLRNQFDDVEEAVRALGLTVWSMNRWEADDALASGAAQFSEAFDEVQILTPDKDLAQCLRGERVVQFDRRQEKRITEATLLRDKGIKPESVPDWLALVGDTADGIPGLDGFGDKAASALLGHYVHLEAIPKLPHDWAVKPRGALKLAETLDAHRTDALLYRKLATLVTDVPLKETPEQLEWRGAPRKQFLEWCERVGSTTLQSRPKSWR